MFWKRKNENNEVKLPGPKEIPELVGRYMVVAEKKEPDWVWKLKGVVRQVGKKEYYCRVFDEYKSSQAKFKVINWTSLDEHPELILWEGYFNKETNEARAEKFERPRYTASAP